MDNLFGLTPPSFQGNLTEFNFIDGLFHGFVFSIPLSAPILICISRFFIQGPIFGFLSFLGTVLGQLCFFFFLCGNSRISISIWYTVEPFLALFGSALAFGFATNLWSGGSPRFFGSGEFKTSKASIWGTGGDFFALARSGSEDFSQTMTSQSFNFFGTRFSFSDAAKIFGLNFLLMFLNPAMPATSSRVLFSSTQLFDYSYGSYSLGFILMSTLAICLIWPFIFSFGIQIIQKGFLLFSPREYGDEIAGGKNKLGQNFLNFFGANKLPLDSEGARTQSKASSPRWNFNSFGSLNGLNWTPSSKASRFLSFLIVGCVMSGTLQYSWRLFTQYPLETVTSMRPSWTTETLQDSRNNAETQGIKRVPNENDWSISSIREFPSFDSNIRHRDKNLPSDRFLPIEKMNARRTLSGRPPLTEEQKSDAYLKFHSFFINSLEKHLENKIIFSRLPEKQKRDVAQIEYLQQLKNELSKDTQTGVKNFFNSYNSQLIDNTNNKELSSSVSRRSSDLIPMLARPIENKTKGKPRFPFVHNLIESENTNSRNGDSSPENYMHDDLRVYQALFGNNANRPLV